MYDRFHISEIYYLLLIFILTCKPANLQTCKPVNLHFIPSGFKMRSLFFISSWSYGVLLWEIVTLGKLHSSKFCLLSPIDDILNKSDSDMLSLMSLIWNGIQILLRWTHLPQTVEYLWDWFIVQHLLILGASPYPGMNSQEVINFLQDGYRMDKPKHCSEEL